MKKNLQNKNNLILPFLADLASALSAVALIIGNCAESLTSWQYARTFVKPPVCWMSLKKIYWNFYFFCFNFYLHLNTAYLLNNFQVRLNSLHAFLWIPVVQGIQPIFLNHPFHEWLLDFQLNKINNYFIFFKFFFSYHLV